MTTASLLLQNALTVTLSSASLIFAPVSINPISYNFPRSIPSLFVRKGSSAGSVERRRERCRTLPTRVLYFL